MRGLTKGLKKLWTLHVPLLVHCTMLSPTRNYKCGNISEVATSEVAIDDLQASTITPLGSLILLMISKLKC